MKNTATIRWSTLALLLLALAAVPAAAQVEVGNIGDLQLVLGVHTVGTAQALTSASARADSVFAARRR